MNRSDITIGIGAGNESDPICHSFFPDHHLNHSTPSHTPLLPNRPSFELSRQPKAHSQSHYYNPESPNIKRPPFSRYKDHPASSSLTTALASLASTLVPQLSTQFPSQPSKRISRPHLQARTTKRRKNHSVLAQAPHHTHSTATSLHLNRLQ